MPADYIPARDAAAAAWGTNFAALIAADPPAYGLTAGNAADITTATGDFTTALATATNPGTRTPATVAAKDGARAAMENVCRPFAMQIQANASVTDEQRTALGLTVRKVDPTPVPTPTEVPALKLIGQTPGVVNLGYAGTNGPKSKNKPEGVKGVEIWAAVGTLPAIDPGQASYRGTVTKSPFGMEFAGSDKGKIVTFFARYTTAGGTGGKNLVGPWSAPLATTVI